MNTVQPEVIKNEQSSVKTKFPSEWLYNNHGNSHPYPNCLILKATTAKV